MPMRSINHCTITLVSSLPGSLMAEETGLSALRVCVCSFSEKAGHRIAPFHPAQWTQTMRRVPFLEVDFKRGKSSAEQGLGQAEDRRTLFLEDAEGKPRIWGLEHSPLVTWILLASLLKD